MLTDFENIEEKYRTAVGGEEYQLLCEKVNRTRRIFLIGNGGLHYVASHMATDLSRLIPDKAVHSFDSVGFITSNANDHGLRLWQPLRTQKSVWSLGYLVREILAMLLTHSTGQMKRAGTLL